MKVLGSLILLAIVAFSSPPVAAQSAQALETCLKGSGGVDPEAQECYRLNNVREDARLNKNWQELTHNVGGLKTEIGALLLKEQRAWVAYKNAACIHYVGQGTYARIEANICLGEIIARRADELKALAERYKEL